MVFLPRPAPPLTPAPARLVCPGHRSRAELGPRPLACHLLCFCGAWIPGPRLRRCPGQRNTRQQPKSVGFLSFQTEGDSQSIAEHGESPCQCRGSLASADAPTFFLPENMPLESSPSPEDVPLCPLCILRTRRASRQGDPWGAQGSEDPNTPVFTPWRCLHRTYSTAPWPWTSSTSPAPRPCTPATAARSPACTSAEVGPTLVSAPPSHHPVWVARAGGLSEACGRGPDKWGGRQEGARDPHRNNHPHIQNSWSWGTWCPLPGGPQSQAW